MGECKQFASLPAHCPMLYELKNRESVMLKNYFKTAFRNLWREKTYSMINIVGLSVGLASCFIILLYSVHELSYDRYDAKLNRIYLLTMDWVIKGLNWTEPLIPFPAGPALKAEYPEVKEYSRFALRQCRIEYQGKSLERIVCASADSSLFKILTLPVVDGNIKEAFSQRDYAIITRRLARKMFGSADPIGKVIQLNWPTKQSYFTVTAVIRNIPSTSTFQADCILPISAFKKSMELLSGTNDYASITKKNEILLDRWGPGIVNAYILLSHGASIESLRSKLPGFSSEHSMSHFFPLALHLFPLKDLYFRPQTMVNTYLIPTGNLSDVEIYSTIALLTLLIACVNLVMLSTARASTRTKDVGVRKVIGASRRDIAVQTMTESVTVAAISLPVALLLVELFMPTLTTLLGKRLPADYDSSFQAILLYVGVTFIAGVLSGSYVSFYLSRLQPAEILRSKFSRGHERVVFRRVLIGIQMVIFAGLILASITIYRQMRYLHTKEMGFNDKNLVVFSDLGISGVDSTIGGRFGALESDLETLPNVSSLACGDRVPGTQYASAMESLPNPSNPQQNIIVDICGVDSDYFGALGIKMIYGKTFAQASPGEAKGAVIINEEAAREFKIKDPSEQLFNGYRILGIVEDFNFLSFHKAIAPTMFFEKSKDWNEIAVRLTSMKGAQRTISSVEKEIEKFDGGKPFRHQFFDQRLDTMYGSDYKFAEMIIYFTALAISIACLGLFGMSMFVIQRRVKEIGVRKVLGASVTSIMFSSAREFATILFISTLVSLPISIHFTDEWLNEFAYHINVSAASVLITFVAGVIIVLVAVGYQALKAATANPVESLRYE